MRSVGTIRSEIMSKRLSDDSKFFICMAVGFMMFGTGISILYHTYNSPSDAAFFGVI